MARKILKLLLIAHGTPFAPMNEWLLTPRAAQKKENPLSIWCPIKIGSTNVPQSTSRVIIDTYLSVKHLQTSCFYHNIQIHIPLSLNISRKFSSAIIFLLLLSIVQYKYCSDLIQNCILPIKNISE